MVKRRRRPDERRASHRIQAGWLDRRLLLQGSADIIHPGLHENIEDWRDAASSEDWDRLGRCKHPGEIGVIYSSYGGVGHHWAGLYCPECMVIVGPLSPYAQDEGWAPPPPQGPDPGPEVFDGHPFPDPEPPPETVRVPRDVLESTLGKKVEPGLLFDLERATLEGVQTAPYKVVLVNKHSIDAELLPDAITEQEGEQSGS